MTETVVTVTAQPQPKQDTNLGWIRFNISYFQTWPGIIKLIQVIIGIICMATASPARIPSTHWFLFVAVTTFIATLLWVFIYLLGIREVLSLAINWVLTELLNTGLATILYFIAFIVQLTGWSAYTGYAKTSNVVAGVFGIFNTVAYGAGTYFLYLQQRNGATQ